MYSPHSGHDKSPCPSCRANESPDGDSPRYSGEERVVFVPTADHNSQLINKAVDEVLAQMFDDQALLSLLASN
jgi:hypothetical protein